MDTKYWGPSGWIMLHTLSMNHPRDVKTLVAKKQAKHLKNIFMALPDILPCIYCRESLHLFYQQHPYPEDPYKPRAVFRWFYTIHNCVNDKLRHQGIRFAPNPSYADVKQKYLERKTHNNRYLMDYSWDFLYSLAMDYSPDRKTSMLSFLRSLSYVVPHAPTRRKMILFFYPPKKKPRLKRCLKNYTTLMKCLYTLEKHLCCSSPIPCFKYRWNSTETYRAACKHNTRVCRVQ